MTHDIDIAAMQLHYIETALWTTCPHRDYKLSVDTIHINAATAMLRDCEDFLVANASDVSGGTFSNNAGQAGIDLWHTRNGYAHGFWSRDGRWGDGAERLTAAARSMGTRRLFIGEGDMLEIEPMMPPRDLVGRTEFCTPFYISALVERLAGAGRYIDHLEQRLEASRKGVK